MEKNVLDSIIENLFNILPLVHKKLLKIDLEAVCKDISRPHFAIMGILDKLGTVPISTIGKKLQMPRPQMTHLVDKLISLGIAERLPDTRDRRIINVTLTAKGISVLKEAKQLVRDSVRKKLSCLNDEELEELSVSLKKLIDIGSKLDKE